MITQNLPSLLYLFLVIILGTIVGLENEYRKQSGIKIYFGLRTSIFITLLGYIFSLIYIMINSVDVLLSGIIAIIVISTALYIEKTNVSHVPGATTYASVFIMFFVGMLVGLGAYQYAIILTILVAAISIYKREFLSVIKKIKRKELLAAINLLLVAFVILPFLPDAYIGPYNLFNPFEFWVIVATVGFVFFLQYMALKTSKRGVLFSSIIGSLITSTAVAFKLISIGNKMKRASKTIIYNIMFSSNVTMILVQGLFFTLLITGSMAITYHLIPVMVVSLIPMLIFMYAGRHDFEHDIEKPANPFPIIETLEFAVLFFAIFTLSRVVAVFDPKMLVLSVFLSGFANVAGTVFSISFLFAHHDITAAYAAMLIGLSISAGLLIKAVLSVLSKNRYIKLRVFTYSIIIGVASLLASLISYYGI